MPSKCSIVGCGAIKSRIQSNLTFHRLPRNGSRKRNWLEAIGKENLRIDKKDILICSLHFKKKYFNKTLDVVRLKDDVVPSLCIQDHLELLFSAIRVRGGFNNNPNAVQFRAALKLFIRAEIRGDIGNCIPLEQINILNCSSKIDPVSSINDLTPEKSLVEVPEDDSTLYEEYLDCFNCTLTKYSESVVTYIAGTVARKLSRAIKCVTCASMLFGNSSPYSLISYKTRSGLVSPSKDVEELCKRTEEAM